jgi:hypothetical protein
MAMYDHMQQLVQGWMVLVIHTALAGSETISPHNVVKTGTLY